MTPAVEQACGAWQPIETAPRDGQTFLAARFKEDEEPDYEVGHYMPLTFERFKPAATQGLYVRELEVIHEWGGFNNFPRMTHWAPIIAPNGGDERPARSD